jgi:UDPglucose--hexose-1-phosphate uridylyltransferase
MKWLGCAQKHWDQQTSAQKIGLLERMIADEIADGRRMLMNEKNAVAFIPVCARYPYETWIAPKRPVQFLHDLKPDELHDLALVLKTMLQKFDLLWEKPFPYLLTLYQAPLDGKAYPEAHLHFQILPPLRTRDRLKYLAGTELGAGVFVNDSLPEEKAAELRNISMQVKS